MSKKDLDALISGLCEDLKPQKPLAHPTIRLMPWILAAIVYVAALAYFVGIRHDMMFKFGEPKFILEVFLAAFVGLSAALASVLLCVPDMRGHKWVLSLPFTGLGIFAVWNIVHMVAHEGMTMPRLHIDHCFGEGVFMTVVPLAMLFFMVKSGTTTRPIMMGVMNIIAVAALAYIGLRCTCAMDTVGHATLLHLLPYVAFGVLLGMVARKFYKW